MRESGFFVPGRAVSRKSENPNQTNRTCPPAPFLPMNRITQIVGLLALLALCFAAAAAGGAATYPRIQGWYAELAKPPWTPPGWLFGPVWTALYTAMAVAAWLVWRQAGLAGAMALGLLAVQLGLNVAWSWLFFGLVGARPDRHSSPLDRHRCHPGVFLAANHVPDSWRATLPG